MSANRFPFLMYEITGPHYSGHFPEHFAARFVLKDGRVAGGQDALKFMAGWNLWQVIKYCEHRGWVFEQVKAGG